MTTKRLKELIDETHKHGLAVRRDIAAAEAKHQRVLLIVLRARLRALEALNRRRWRELHTLEHPTVKPQRYTQYDAVDVSAIPHGAGAVAGYIDGFANFPEMVRSFPGARHLSIAVHAGTDADALDIEPGAAVPGDAPAWVRRQHGRGKVLPVVYAPEGMMPETLQALDDSGIRRTEFQLWVAHWVGSPRIDPGYDAMQWLGNTSGGYDISLCEPWFN